jgi:diadenosine tetraphosphate (Ap4A) HIT family hydrolase
LDVVEQRGVWSLVKQIQKRIEEGLQVKRFHVGFADSADSQDHARVHVVPQALDEQMELPSDIEWVSEP